MTSGSIRGWATLAYLILLIFLGGASAAGFSANVLLQLGGVVLIAWTMWSSPAEQGLKTGTKTFFIALAILALVQFLPLPPGLWQTLPGRERVAEGFELAGFALPWLTISLDPWASIQSLAWWLPPFAVFVASRSAHAPRVRHIILAVQVIAYASVILATVQTASGSAYLYTITNFGNGVGLFANSNHFGSFMLIAMALTAGQWVHGRESAPRIKPRINPHLVLISLLLPFAVGVFLSNSMACMLLMVPLLAGIVLIDRSNVAVRWSIVGIVGAAISAGLVWLLTSGVLTNDLTGKSGTTGISRGEFLDKGLAILGDFAPFGSGIGTFRDLYTWYEDPTSVGTTFVNHAHNDLLELTIETGVLGLGVLALFLWWFGRRTFQIWNSDRSENPVALSATLAISVVLIHSLVDYPLRTATVSGLIALCIVLMCRSSEPKGSAPQSVPGSGKREEMLQI